MVSENVIAREQVTALILAAGEGLRMGRSKGFLRLNNQTLIERAILTVVPFCSEIILGLRVEDQAKGQSILVGMSETPIVSIVVGGATRQETITRLVNHATKPFVLLHEVARPFGATSSFVKVLGAAFETGAAALYRPLRPRDSLALIDGTNLDAILPRNRVIALQTPQAYRRDLLVEVHQRATRESWSETGTPALVKRAGYPVQLVPGTDENIKITYPEDWYTVLEKADQRAKVV